MRTNIIQLLEHTAQQHPDKLALIDNKREMTYSQYLEEVRHIGLNISIACKQQMNKPVMVLVDRQIEPIVLFMAVLYSGNIYVPVDEKMPKDRLAMMIETVDPVAIVGTELLIREFEVHHLEVPQYTYEALLNEVPAENHGKPFEKLIDMDPAYIIFTSGSTGKPKGIAVSHVNVLDLVLWMEDAFDFVESDVLGNQTPFYFDASVKDIYIAMKKGATLTIIPQMFFMFHPKLMDWLNDKKVTTILWATSAMNLVAKSKILEKNTPCYIDKIFFAGEAMYGKTINIWKNVLPDATYVNLYGPTEATVDATYYVLDRTVEDDEPIPIGKACKNMAVFLEPTQMDQISKEVEKDYGEICIRGKGVALGYYNDQEKTSQVFVQNPHNHLYRDLIYRTGDIGRYNDQGMLVFLSRVDHQIKHKGYRIELGEIEMQGLSHKDVVEAVCIYDLDAKKMIFCYTGMIDNKPMRTYLLEKVPGYMVPDVIIKLAAMPHTANEKIDRKGLMKLYLKGEI